MNKNKPLHLAFQQEAATTLSFKDQILMRMQQLKLSKSKLAFRLRTSPAYVTKLLTGETNLTVETMAKLSQALEAELHLQLIPKKPTKDWTKIMEKVAPMPAPEQKTWAQFRQKRARANDVEEGLFGPIAPQERFRVEDYLPA